MLRDFLLAFLALNGFPHLEPRAPGTWWDMSRPMYKWFGSDAQSSNDLKPRRVRGDFFKLTQWGVFLAAAEEEEQEDGLLNIFEKFRLTSSDVSDDVSEVVSVSPLEKSHLLSQSEFKARK